MGERRRRWLARTITAATWVAALPVVVSCDSASLVRVDGSSPAADASEPDAFALDARAADAGPIDASMPDARADDGGPADLGPDARPDAGPVVVPAAPRAVFPWRGWTSGSALANPAPPARHPRRPRFVWAASTDASDYRIQLTTECVLAAYDSCPFVAASIDERVGATTFTPAEELPVELVVPPLGRRYFWRVAACNAAGCSAFTEVRYLDVGRLHDDFDGDGYSDAVVGAPNQDVSGVVDAGAAYVFSGSASGLSPSRWAALRNPVTDASIATVSRFGHNVAAVGDIDADGFADAVVGAPYLDARDDGGTLIADAGGAYVYRGSASGLVASPIVLASPTIPTPESAWFGSAVAGPGDLDGDGRADVVVAAHRQDDMESQEGRAFVYRGRPEGVDPEVAETLANPAPSALARFGRALAGRGDFDGDGYVDLVVGAPQARTHTGQAHVFRGGPGALALVPAITLGRISEGYFGFALAASADVDGDGLADAVVGAFRSEDATMLDDSGGVLVYLGRAPSGLRASSEMRVLPPVSTENGYFGFAVGASDLDGDGRADLVIGAPGQGTLGEGEVFVARSDGSFDETPASVAHPAPQASSGFGAALVVNADFDGDGHVDLLVSAPNQDRVLEDVGAVFALSDPTGAFVSAPAVRIDHPEGEEQALFGFSLDGVGGSDPGS